MRSSFAGCTPAKSGILFRLPRMNCAAAGESEASVSFTTGAKCPHAWPALQPPQNV